MSRASRQSGCASPRQYSANAQRGSDSPGYHLPWPKCSRPPGANRSRSRPINVAASARLWGPCAAVFHSGASTSSMATNVGSPPIVSRTSPSASCSSTDSPERIDRRPFVLGVRVRHARRFDDPLDVHRERELDVPRVRHAGDRRGAARVRSARERNVALAGEQARGGVEADPARTGQVHLGPGVQVGEVLVGAGRPVECGDVRLELNQVTRHESSREPKAPQDLHEQPGRVAAGSFPARQRLLAGLHARLHPDHVVDVLVELPVQFDEEVDRCDRAAIDPCPATPSAGDQQARARGKAPVPWRCAARRRTGTARLRARGRSRTD